MPEMTGKELRKMFVNKKTTWTAWSLYLPEFYYKEIYPAKKCSAQFHK